MKYILNDYHRNITNEELLEDILRVNFIIGKETLTQAEYKIYGKYGLNTYRRRFGGWNDALMLCGIVPNAHQIAGAQSSFTKQEISTEELLADIRRVAQNLGKRTISSGEYDELGKFSRYTCFKRFPSWNEVLTQAGLEPFAQVSGRRIDDDDLLKEIEHLWISLGRQPTATDIKNGWSQYSLNTYSRRFGGWRGALDAFIKWSDKKSGCTEIQDD